MAIPADLNYLIDGEGYIEMSSEISDLKESIKKFNGFENRFFKTIS